jgi:hypothetical protein
MAQTRFLVLAIISVVIAPSLGGCGGGDANAPNPSTAKLKEGFYAANDSSFPYPLVALKVNVNAMDTYDVIQLSCQGTFSGYRGFAKVGSVSPYIGGSVYLEVIEPVDGSQCGMAGTVEPDGLPEWVLSPREIVVKVFDTTKANYLQSPPMATATLSMVSQEQFAAKFVAFGFRATGDRAQPLGEGQQGFCHGLFNKSCQEVLK